MSSIAAVTCSYAFMLPVATAPNAIVFGASTMKTGDMMKAGLFMNIASNLQTKKEWKIGQDCTKIAKFYINK